MGPLDRIAASDGLVYRRRNEVPAQGPRAGIADLRDDDPLAAARGAVNGVFWGTILWAVILGVLP